jgi:hypothetical protein
MGHCGRCAFGAAAAIASLNGGIPIWSVPMEGWSALWRGLVGPLSFGRHVPFVHSRAAPPNKLLQLTPGPGYTPDACSGAARRR